MSSENSRRFSIKTKLLLLVLALLLIPWMGFYYVQELKQFLLKGQEEALLLTARGIATVLNDRTELFDPATGVPEVIGESEATFAPPLEYRVRLDGNAEEWSRYLHNAKLHTGLDDTICTIQYDPDSFSYFHVLGYRGQNLYILFRVHDDTLVYRDRKLRRLDNSDHVRITFQNPEEPLKHYLLTARKSGPMSVYEVDENFKFPLTGEPVYDITAVLSEADSGYDVEVRIPRRLLGYATRLGFAVADVDDSQRRVVTRAVTAMPLLEDEALPRVMIFSPELKNILQGFDRPVGRIWILDKNRQIRTVIGDLGRSRPTEQQDQAADPLTARPWLASVFDPVFNLIFSKPTLDFEDVQTDLSMHEEQVFTDVLAGIPQAQRRPSHDNRAEILMAAFPIYSGELVLGAVVVEQSSSEVLSLQHEALQNLAVTTVVVFIFVTVTLLFFASHLTLRITRLRSSTERSISPEGRVRDDYTPPYPHGNDEVGDLSRSISSMLRRLSEYTRYLEQMPDTLAHELSNPLNVVNSSLENLRSELPATQHSKYMDRATNGIIRLRSILTNLTEAANLEEALQSEDREIFNLTDLVSGCVEGYRVSNPERIFHLDITHSPLMIKGAADHVAQMLDKLADNALDFGLTDRPIIVRLQKVESDVALSVINEGPSLPESMKDRIFDPMISVGKKDAGKSHLGLGLFVVRLVSEYHQGKVVASNRGDGNGAEFTVLLPLAS